MEDFMLKLGSIGRSGASLTFETYGPLGCDKTKPDGTGLRREDTC